MTDSGGRTERRRQHQVSVRQGTALVAFRLDVRSTVFHYMPSAAYPMPQVARHGEFAVFRFSRPAVRIRRVPVRLSLLELLHGCLSRYVCQDTRIRRRYRREAGQTRGRASWDTKTLGRTDHGIAWTTSRINISTKKLSRWPWTTRRRPPESPRGPWPEPPGTRLRLQVTAMRMKRTRHWRLWAILL